ncbi:MAG: DUF4250 domain-containing protein [Lachnospiraceae bacterium]|nr:DUF4250 domain-containing protein [Lachnospiraceae bacterium]
MLPKDPMILLSVVNTMLRDKYSSLDALLDDLGDDAKDIVEKLKSINYSYDAESNRFV